MYIHSSAFLYTTKVQCKNILIASFLSYTCWCHLFSNLNKLSTNIFYHALACSRCNSHWASKPSEWAWVGLCLSLFLFHPELARSLVWIVVWTITTTTWFQFYSKLSNFFSTPRPPIFTPPPPNDFLDWFQLLINSSKKKGLLYIPKNCSSIHFLVHTTSFYSSDLQVACCGPFSRYNILPSGLF